MHQHLLFAPVPATNHNNVLAQLSGIAAMPPLHILERHLIFKPFRKPGLTTVGPATTTSTSTSTAAAAAAAGGTTASGTATPTATTLGGTQDHPQSADVQRLNKILNGAMHYVRAVGRLREEEFVVVDNGGGGGDSNGDGDDGDAMDEDTPQSQSQTTSSSSSSSYSISNQEWEIRFEDTPLAGNKFPVTTRYATTASLPYGDPLPFLNSLGFNYISEYILEGHRFIIDGIVLFLYRVLLLPPPPPPQPQSQPPESTTPSTPPIHPDLLKPAKHLPTTLLQDGTLLPLDSSGAYILQASISVSDGGGGGGGGGVADPELVKTARERLLALRDRLKLLVSLDVVDRLALDTRAK